MRSSTYTVVFVSTVAIICSLLLSTAATLLRDRQDRNEALSKKQNILKALGVNEKMDGPSIDIFFAEYVELFAIDLEGNIDAEVDATQLDMEVEDKKAEASARRYPIYRCAIDNETTYCVPIIGRGLWSKLYGYLSLESDLNTVKGITFYKHGETPGLGAEIAASIQERAFDYLDAPVKRVGAPFSPVPFSPVLEAAWLPGKDQLRAAIEEIVPVPA